MGVEEVVGVRNEIPKNQQKILKAIFTIYQKGRKNYADICAPLFTHKNLGHEVFLEAGEVDEIEITKPQVIYDSVLNQSKIITPILRFNPVFIDENSAELLTEKLVEILDKYIEDQK